MTLFHCHIATSLDGMIARPDGGVDWLVEGAPPPEAFGFDAFYDQVALILMGRGTYEAARRMGDWPYAGKPALVVTSRPLDDAPPGVETRPGDLPALVAELRQRGLGLVWVEGGGQLLRGLLGIGALDRLEMAVVPVILGAGIPLFPPGTPETRLVLRQSATVGDALHLIYEPA
ncbi:dihydrofolate reductase family protein [Falsiroseomonas sp.]|uniref:dihydrofolate reductase family protein n=1 Tax=Falsiroseomonas sp. TaxID=2870721 RepID=UPI0027351F86|nr:dihydrofolate reductase family protein [Falsiroseomonas sp.]MDP3415845.1 dihydrofolate reductase family protein [Falsiroseomonas sp.]